MVRSVLIIDDDEVFRETMRGAMERRGLRAWATSGMSAANLFREQQPDLVVLDYRMPGLDGISVLRSMHVMKPSSIFVLLTGFGTVPLAVEAMKEGADSVLTKPCDVEHILTEAEKINEKKKKRVSGMELAEFRSFNLDILERTGIEKALQVTEGNVSKAAVLLGIDRRTLQRKMKRFFALALFLSFSVMGLSEAFAEENKSVGVKIPSAQRIIELTGDEEYGDEQSGWDRTYARSTGYVFGREPVTFLKNNFEVIPKGRVLDIAMGEGRNAVFLAKKGYKAEGVDISEIAIRKAQRLAAENGVKITTTTADLNKYKIKPRQYEGIIVFYYLQRNLIPQIRDGLKKGGVVIFETNTVEHLKNPGGHSWNRDFLLQPGELKQMFSGFEILSYSETNKNGQAVASLVARKVN